MRLRSRILGIMLGLAATGCGATDESPAMELFPSKAFLYGCEAWSPSRPPAEWSVFDIPAWGAGKDSVVAAVAAMGGWTTARFNMSKVRAAIPVDSVPALYARGMVGRQQMTGTVADSSDRTIAIAVMLDDSLTVADLDTAVALGALVTDVWMGLNGYLVRADDSLLPMLSLLPRVKVAAGGMDTPICGMTGPVQHR